MWLHRFLRRWRPRYVSSYPLLFRLESDAGPQVLDAAEDSQPTEPRGATEADDHSPRSTLAPHSSI